MYARMYMENSIDFNIEESNLLSINLIYLLAPSVLAYWSYVRGLIADIKVMLQNLWASDWRVFLFKSNFRFYNFQFTLYAAVPALLNLDCSMDRFSLDVDINTYISAYVFLNNKYIYKCTLVLLNYTLSDYICIHEYIGWQISFRGMALYVY